MATLEDDAPSDALPHDLEEGGAQDLDALIAAAQRATGYGQTGAAPLLDFRALLEPIPGDEPAGGGVPFGIREQLEQARKEINPDNFPEDDPLRPADLVRANWPLITEVTQQVLRETSKNLLIAARLLEALTKQHGFTGLRDGLHLLRLLVEICWNRLDPPLEDDDLEVRAAPFNWLDDPDRGAYFPNSVRNIPLLGTTEQYSWFDWSQAQENRGGMTMDLIERAIYNTTREQCQAVHDELMLCSVELRHLSQFLDGKLRSDAPGFTSLRPAIDDAIRLIKLVLQKKGPAAGGQAAEADSAAPVGDGGPAAAGAGLKPTTRSAVYAQLAEAADALERLEPHSPVPFLIRRAVELGALPFPQLMQALIRDANVLAEMSRELGIKMEQSSE